MVFKSFLALVIKYRPDAGCAASVAYVRELTGWQQKIRAWKSC
jgi:hypothetical protein